MAATSNITAFTKIEELRLSNNRGDTRLRGCLLKLEGAGEHPKQRGMGKLSKIKGKKGMLSDSRSLVFTVSYFEAFILKVLNLSK